MSHKNVRPFIVKVSVLGYFPLIGYSLLMNIVIFKVKIKIINLSQLRVLFNIILDVISLD